MALKVLAADGVKIYNLSSGKSLPEWVSDKKRRALPADAEQGVELLQDFHFPSSCRKIRSTPNGDCLVACGNYPPQVRLFDVANLSAKVTRHFDADIVDFEVLTEDFSKLAFLCADRTVKLHARFGHYHEARIPICGRVTTYLPFLAHLLVAGSSSELHRLDLAEGKFLEPVHTHLDSINACDLNPVLGLLCCGGSDGYVDRIDPRQSASVGSLDVAHAMQKEGVQITAVKFEEVSGFQYAAGSSDGTVALFDLRSQKPLIIKDHMYDAPIHSLHYLQPESGANKDQMNKIASVDSFVVKIWDTLTAETYTNVEPGKNANINHLHWWRDSGLFFLACEDSRIQSYFIPSLGTAPPWCSFLEGMTEELEEEAGHVLYDDYRFVTQKELMEVGLSHLIGTELLKAYMHGYFIHNKLYSKAQLMNKPQKAVPMNLPESRISTVKRVAEGERQKATVRDDRFKAIYEDPAFRIDPNRPSHQTDSLLVPPDSIDATTESIDDATLPFGQRSSNRRAKKTTRVSGTIDFTFTPKSRTAFKRRPVRRRGY